MSIFLSKMEAVVLNIFATSTILVFSHLTCLDQSKIFDGL